LSRRSRPDAGGFIGKAYVQRIAINVAMDRNCANSHFLAGPDDATSNLATIGNQDLFKFATSRIHIDPKSKV